MEVPDLAELVQRPGPFLTVQLATEASVENASQRNEQRWQARREELASSETPKDVLDAVDPLIADAHLRGETLFVVASAEGLHHASHWPGLPFREFSYWQALPVLAPLLDLRQSLPPHVLVLPIAVEQTSPPSAPRYRTAAWTVTWSRAARCTGAVGHIGASRSARKTRGSATPRTSPMRSVG